MWPSGWSTGCGGDEPAAVDYLFNEEATALPDLGGIQSTLEKRMRHRRALVRMLFEHWRPTGWSCASTRPTSS